MTIQKIKNSMYDMETWLGDSGSLTIGNLPTDIDGSGWTLYFEIRGKETIVKEIPLTGQETVDIFISVDDTTRLGVGQWEYGVKLCSGVIGQEGLIEDTYIPDIRVSKKAYIVVNPKVVEGVINE